MLLNTLCIAKKLSPTSINSRVTAISKCSYSNDLDSKYNELERQKILQVMNSFDESTFAGYDISKANIKKFSQWKSSNGQLKTLSDIEYIEGFSERSAKKLYNSILNGPTNTNVSGKIKGQILHPHLSENVVMNCKSILSIYVTVNSVCWMLVNKENYEVQEWKYHSIGYPDTKKLQITDIFDISWKITQEMPIADIYVMKAAATTLRAAGSDPNNPKVIAVNLQKSQMVAMIVALINSRGLRAEGYDDDEDSLSQSVYFLRPTLPYRLYGTLVGNERVSTEQTVDILLKELSTKSSNNSHAYIPEDLLTMYWAQKDLQKDMLGHCLLLCLTFMDLCIYKNKDKIAKLIKRGN